MSSEDTVANSPPDIASLGSQWQTVTEPETIAVEAQRLSRGTWCHEKRRRVGNGDVHAAFSSDLIGKGRVRKPFLLGQWRRVTTSIESRAEIHATAYRLIPIDSYEGTAVTFNEKLSSHGDDDAADDPLGFYHGMRVTYAGQTYVLVGPPVTIVPAEPAPIQPELF